MDVYSVTWDPEDHVEELCKMIEGRLCLCSHQFKKKVEQFIRKKLYSLHVMILILQYDILVSKMKGLI